MNNEIALHGANAPTTGSALMDDIHSLADLLDQWTPPPLLAAEKITLADEDRTYPDGSTVYRREITVTNPSAEVVSALLKR